MKRVGHLLERIAESENLREAFLIASRARSGRSDVLAYRENLTEHLGTLREQILTESVPFGVYRQFHVFDPKERLITVAPFWQRVLHHAIMLRASRIWRTSWCRGRMLVAKARAASPH